MNAPLSVSDLKSNGGAVATMPDQAVDMFTERGFALANRIAKAYANSDAVPAQFRMQNLKKAGGNETWVENPAAMGNCIVAIEVARAVGMSIASVMQNADMIEGKLRWSGKFVIAAINASGRFTPLRFNMRPLGRIKASYKEKTGWDNQARRPTFTERTVEVDDVECIAWALPRGFQIPPGIYSLDQARKAGLPVIESAPVTMKLAVEEGWYGKPGSKWQTGLAPLMFQYRAGTFFGNIHAPDVVMGMGRTAEEERDIGGTGTFEVFPDGSVHQVPVSELRPQEQPAPVTEIVQRTDAATGEITTTAAVATAADPADTIADQISRADSAEAVTALDNDISRAFESGALTADAADVLTGMLERRHAELIAAKAQQPAATGRRPRPAANIE